MYIFKKTKDNAFQFFLPFDTENVDLQNSFRSVGIAAWDSIISQSFESFMLKNTEELQRKNYFEVERYAERRYSCTKIYFL